MDESFFDPGEAWENVLEHLEFHGFEIDRGAEGVRVCHEKGGAFSLSPLLDGVLFEWSYPETAEAAENRREYLEWINAANGELPALRFFSDAAKKRLVQDAWCPPGYRRRDFEQFLRTVFSERQTFLLREGLSRFVELGE
jgi:hypothetical protein